MSVYGVASYREAVEHSLDMARYAAEKIHVLPYLNLFMEPVLSVVVFERHGWGWEQYKIWSTEQLKNQVCYAVPSLVDQKPVLRFAFLNPEMTMGIIDEILISLE